MNWKLILQLSLFGLAMAFATVYVIPSSVEPFLWLPIFVLCAWLIAKRAPGKVFLHGLLLGIMNSIWITAAHVLLFAGHDLDGRGDDEARRLLYIAMTRAREELCVSYYGDSPLMEELREVLGAAATAR